MRKDVRLGTFRKEMWVKEASVCGQKILMFSLDRKYWDSRPDACMGQEERMRYMVQEGTTHKPWGGTHGTFVRQRRKEVGNG